MILHRLGTATPVVAVKIHVLVCIVPQSRLAQSHQEALLPTNFLCLYEKPQAVSVEWSLPPAREWAFEKCWNEWGLAG